MMTTAAALMGALPIALGMGADGEARRPLGVAVAGGLAVSQLLTLYITPVFYVCIDQFRSLWVGPHNRVSNEVGPADVVLKYLDPNRSSLVRPPLPVDAADWEREPTAPNRSLPITAINKD
jgi:hypothetical protein